MVRPKAIQRRVGFMLESESRFHHFLTVGANPSDGGVIVTPTARPSGGWTYLTRNRKRQLMRSSYRWDTAGALTSVPGEAMKLHYHRSGFTSLQPGSGGNRVSVDLPDLDTISGQQIFCAAVTDPQDLPEREPRRGDSFVVLHGEWPSAAAVAGIIVARRDIPDVDTELLADSARGLVRGAASELVVDLSAHGLDAVLLLRFDHSPAVTGQASVTLAGVCGDTSTDFEAVVAYTNDGVPRVGVHPRLDSAEVFPAQAGQRTTDRRRVVRTLDADPEYGDFM